MSKIDMLKAAPKQIEIAGVAVSIKPLKLKNLDLLMDLSSDDSVKQSESMKQIILLTLRDAFPDATDDDINDVSIEHFEKISSSILEINGLKKKKE